MQDELLPSEVEQVESVSGTTRVWRDAKRPLKASLLIVTKLILSLYEPASPSTIAKTQSTLSRLQSSPQAWTLAHHLLGRPDDKVKFFGALTIIVKLNTEKYAFPPSALLRAEL